MATKLTAVPQAKLPTSGNDLKNAGMAVLGVGVAATIIVFGVGLASKGGKFWARVPFAGETFQEGRAALSRSNGGNAGPRTDQYGTVMGA